MFNILLVDDEKSILDGLYFNIEWSNHEIYDVFRASHSEEALLVMSNNRIDIVITDIRMPGINGLSLCEAINHLYPKTKIIILSGYREFSYAHRAIEFNVHKYIVKPAPYEEIEQAVDELVEIIKNELQQSQLIADSEQKLEKMKPILIERRLIQMLEGNNSSLIENQNSYTFPYIDLTKYSNGHLISIKIFSFLNSGIRDRSEIIVQDLAKDFFPQKNYHYFYHNDCYIFLFLSSTTDSNEEAFNAFIAQLEMLQISIDNTMVCESSIFWDYPVDLGLLPSSYQRIKRRILSHSFMSPGGVIGPEGNKESNNLTLPSLFAIPSLKMLISEFDKEQVYLRIERVFRELSEDQYKSRENFILVYHFFTGNLMSDSIERNVNLLRLSPGSNEYLQSLGTINTLEIFKEKTLELFSDYFQIIEEDRSSLFSKITLELKEIISTNAAEKILVSNLAKHFNYSPAYLSRNFKTETGFTLQEYIIHVKMNKAKELLERGTLAKEVASMVGYENYPHFSRTFKKYIGISPKQFQNRKNF